MAAVLACSAGGYGGGGGGGEPPRDGAPACSGAQQNCAGACVDLARNASHCGACGAACGAGQRCEEGVCIDGCPAPRATCEGVCADLQSDARNCAACGRACGVGESCVAGACVGSATPDASAPPDASASPDGSVDASTMGACVPLAIGSALGDAVAVGTTLGRADTHTPPDGCSDTVSTPSPDMVWRWTAPTSGAFTFDTRGSTYDTLLTVRVGGCAGTALACNDDLGDGGQQSSVTVALTAGQVVVVALDGYRGAAGSYRLNIHGDGAPDAAVPDVPAVDPCGGVTIDGRCVSASVGEYCSVPLEGDGVATLRRFTCPSGERCTLSIDGVATCEPTGPCREGAIECVGATAIRTCTGGAWRTQSCARTCVVSPVGDFCAADVPVRTITGRVAYDARGPNSTTAPTDWSATSFRAWAQGFLMLSGRFTASGSNQLYDATFTSLGTVDGGTYTLRVPTAPTADDRVIVMAVAADEQGNLKYVVANPRFATPGEQDYQLAPTNPVAWGWTWNTTTLVPGGTLVITEAMGSGAARIYDYLRYAYAFARNQFGRDGLKLVVWFQPGTSWSCGACMWQSNIRLFGTETSAGEQFATQGFLSGSSSQGYWSDAVTAHELGHWVMDSYSAPPSEAGRHILGGRVYPGMAWSEGFATWFSSDVRSSSLYYDKQDGAFFWFDIGARRYGATATPTWVRPVASEGLEQRIDENEVSAMMWGLRGATGENSPAMYRALASGHMQGPTFARGYRAWEWSRIDGMGTPLGAVRSSRPAPHFADFLDALVCNGFRPSTVDAVTQPTRFYPYPSASPRCF